MELYRSENQIHNWIRMAEPIIIKGKKQVKNAIASNRMSKYFGIKWKKKKTQKNYEVHYKAKVNSESYCCQKWQIKDLYKLNEYWDKSFSYGRDST